VCVAAAMGGLLRDGHFDDAFRCAGRPSHFASTERGKQIGHRPLLSGVIKFWNGSVPLFVIRFSWKLEFVIVRLPGCLTECKSTGPCHDFMTSQKLCTVQLRLVLNTALIAETRFERSVAN
jgi:hypothetical protein